MCGCGFQNPEAANPPNAGLGRTQKADYPKDKKKEFEGTPGGYSWISAKDPSLLDFNGCELVLIATHADISGAPTLTYPAKMQLHALPWIVCGKFPDHLVHGIYADLLDQCQMSLQTSAQLEIVPQWTLTGVKTYHSL